MASQADQLVIAGSHWVWNPLKYPLDGLYGTEGTVRISKQRVGTYNFDSRAKPPTYLALDVMQIKGCRPSPGGNVPFQFFGTFLALCWLC